MISTITNILIDHVIEIACSSAFVAGVGTYLYLTTKGKTNKYKLVYYDITDRVIKSKKIQKRISDSCGGTKKDAVAFKAA